MEHIIAKIDNDFNPDNSDWISRVPAWCTDAMSQLKILRSQYKKRTLIVNNKIAHSPCPITRSKGFKVYDNKGCEIKELNETKRCCNNDDSSTGGLYENTQLSPSDTIYATETNKTEESTSAIQIHVNTDDIHKRDITFSLYNHPVKDRNYVIVDDYTIELNFDTDKITIINLELLTEYSEYFDSEIPVVPNNGLLIEALSYYCMYKMLCRGMKHPVFNLAASQYGTNPYYMWTQLSNKAKASVIADVQDEKIGEIGNAWRQYFYNYTFPK